MQQNYQKQVFAQGITRQIQERVSLALLVQTAKECRAKTPKIGDVVLVGSDDHRRLQWPMARIVELIPGQDGVLCTDEVKTQTGILLRPVQHLYLLEVSTEKELDIVSCGQSVKPDDLCNPRQSPSAVSDSGTAVHIRSGRHVTKPRRYQD